MKSIPKIYFIFLMLIVKRITFSQENSENLNLETGPFNPSWESTS